MLWILTLEDMNNKSKEILMEIKWKDRGKKLYYSSSQSFNLFIIGV